MKLLTPHTRGLAVTALGVLIVSPDALLARLIEVDMWTLIFWRALFLGIGVVVLIAILTKGQLLNSFRSLGRPGIPLALFNALGMSSFIFAVHYTSVANTLLILSTTPLFAALASWVLMREPLPIRTWLAILLVMVGIAVISSATSAGDRSLQGDLAALLGAFSLGTCFSIARRYRDRSMLPSISVGALITVFILFPVADPFSTSSTDMFYLVLMGLVMLPVGMACMYYGPRHVPSSEIGLLMLLESVLGPLWVWWILEEVPTQRTFMGGAIILSALVMHLILSVKRESA